MPSIFFPFPVPLTGRQYFYILIVQGLVAAIIDAGANFGIAYAMYHSQSIVRMWVFSENTIAGDLGVTPLIQTAVSMIISSALIHSDLHHHAIRPLPFVWPHVEHLPNPARFFGLFRREKTVPDRAGGGKDESGTSSPVTEKASNKQEDRARRGIQYYTLMLIRFIFEGTENNMLLDWHGPGTFFKRLVLTGVQGLGLGVVFGLPLWCLAVVILGPIYGTGNMGNKWAPQAIKLVYGFLVGLITNPIIALLALGSQAEHHLVFLDAPGDIEAHAGTAVHIGPPAGPAADLSIISEDDVSNTVLPATPGPVPVHSASRIRSLSTVSRAGLPVGGRARRASSTSLTANVSALRTLPPTTPILSPGHEPAHHGTALAPAIDTPTGLPLSSPRPVHIQPPGTTMTPPRARRPRATTASSTGTGSFYALGGTGGRAQRVKPRTRASTLSGKQAQAPTGEQMDTAAREGEEGQEVLDDGVAAVPPARARSATTSNSTPQGTTGARWDTPDAGNRDRVEVPGTPTREGRRRGMVRMLTGSRESMR